MEPTGAWAFCAPNRLCFLSSSPVDAEAEESPPPPHSSPVKPLPRQTPHPTPLLSSEMKSGESVPSLWETFHSPEKPCAAMPDPGWKRKSSWHCVIPAGAVPHPGGLEA